MAAAASTKGQTKQGIVVSNKMTNTVVVVVNRYKLDPKYRKRYLVTKKYYADTAGKNYEVGEEVILKESRPLSKLKRWVVLESLGKGRGKQADFIESEAVEEVLA
ncbi:MAG: 30S ribosomal protein S17 [Candidatus Abawacabacteria bacterium RIFCSPHIGHO2_01_FULL_46_8]|uniref:30S ribosomal protein S17 n=1 Tax=Candidatus Abawacabacteria bacterium RIFCSPHIGHO2_01_FULL_46_8 TaxID=1817815 RepID=A0A1F4XMQ9_9BACT|nr:ribosomal protein S17 [uncultured bacterium]OGC82939.1 MAG: 30S ribosomal protein S17 [Candidatus Abawacabacteria bacterium RIFCSPHIGHO2_01_FULL_46_8]